MQQRLQRQHLSYWNLQGQQGMPFNWFPPGAFFVPRPTPKPKISRIIWAVNQKTTCFFIKLHWTCSCKFSNWKTLTDYQSTHILLSHWNVELIISINATTLCFYLLVVQNGQYFAKCESKNASATIQLDFLTQIDQTDLLAKLMLDQDKFWNH